MNRTMNRTSAVALGLTVFGAAGLGASFAAPLFTGPATQPPTVRKPYVLTLTHKAADASLACRRMWRVSTLRVGQGCRKNTSTPAQVAEVAR